ncbi:hypothetical protein GLOIN_2v1778495 [Rhizophagus clarus]|uniref:Uncharacterized protein n=1 Tax=Rhizophagus clarus TaxID=94130 RepID=A0A8H3KR01_9GLOM|nr:hypothetical protein GLOIN_2v1778495 [Rhizophagus clarus]
MAKIHLFYVFNIKNELAYISQQYTENEVYKMINESILLQFEEKNETDNRRNIPILDISNHEVNNISDNKSDGENELNNSKNIEMKSNYNIKELIQ